MDREKIEEFIRLQYEHLQENDGEHNISKISDEYRVSIVNLFTFMNNLPKEERIEFEQEIDQLARNITLNNLLNQ